jgi:GxxExxY protein
MAALELAIEVKTKKDSPQSHRVHREEPGGRDMESDSNQLTQAVIGAAIEVHKALGPGLLESAYEQCLCRDLKLRGVSFQRQRPVPLEYKGIELECGYRVDLLVEASVVVEIKAVTKIEPVHEAQLLTYMKLGHWKLGLLINFNVPLLKDGIRRRVL